MSCLWRSVTLPATLSVLLTGCFGDGVVVLPPTSAYDGASLKTLYGAEDADCGSRFEDCLPHHRRYRPRTDATEKQNYVQPPTFNLNATCAASSKFQKSDDGHYCLTDEYAAKTQLNSKWTTFRAADRRDCVEQSRAINPSYVETLTCLELGNNTMIASTASHNKQVGDPRSKDVPFETDTTGSLKQFPSVEPAVKGYTVPP